jgi:homoserine O-succinyltransferase
LVDKGHPLVSDVNTLFDVPHSRFNEISHDQFHAAGLQVLAESEEAGVHLAVSEDGFRIVFFQGHPEYDTVSLLKEYKREVGRFATARRKDYPPFPQNYIGLKDRAILGEHRDRVLSALDHGREPPSFPEERVAASLDNTWHDTAEGVVGNWMGKIYQLTNSDRRLPFMDGVDPRDPLRLRG